MRSGVVAIAGRANAGKSTLINYLAGEKVSIVSPVPQTTRNLIRAVYNDPRGQAVFCDMPGMNIAKHSLDRAMISLIRDSLSGADIVLYLVDASKMPKEEEQMAMGFLLEQKKPVILGLNKIDISVKHISDYLRAWEARMGSPLSSVTDRLMPVPISALKGTNTDKLLDEIFSRLPEGGPLYPEDILTDFPRQWMIQDVIREKLLFMLREELPFSLAVHVNEVTERKNGVLYVMADILVERDTQKAIVIGHKGSVLRKAGEAGRKELETIFGNRFFLELFVKVDKDWKEDRELLKELGYIL